MPTRPIFGEGRSGIGTQPTHLFRSTGVMGTACQEGILGNVGDPSRMWGRDPQQYDGLLVRAGVGEGHTTCDFG
jgi:hypothetical protein